MHPYFVDAPETHTWFQDMTTVSAEEMSVISVPDAPIWKQWLRYVEVPDEYLDEVIRTTPDPGSEPELYEILQRAAALLLRRMGMIENPYRFAALADYNDPQSKYFFVQVLTSLLPFVREYHRSLGIPEEFSQATLADIGRNIRVHKKREGVGGLQTHWWLMLHVRGVIYQLGRLQFERKVLDNELAEAIRSIGHEARPGDPVLSVHIPDFMGHMGHDACTASISQAVDFYATYFPDWPVRFAMCDSWLLDPQLKKYLSEESNIIRFQNRFNLLAGKGEMNDTVMQFVFGRHVRDINTIHSESSLGRGVLTHLQAGGNWYSRTGWFALPETLK